MKTHGKSLAVAVLAAASLVACGKKHETKQSELVASPTPSEVVVKIGHAAPLTGPQSHLGKDYENGARLALEDLNLQSLEIGGAKVKFELISEDDQADPRQGTVVAQKLVDAQVKGVIGHLNSGTTIPASKLYADAGIPQISASATNPKYTQQGFKTAFRVMANDVQQGKVLGEFAMGVLQSKKIAIIDDRTAYGQGLADEFEKAVRAVGGTVVAREFTTDKSTDFAAILTSIKSKQPDLVFFGGMDAQAGPMVKQLRTLGVTARFLGGDGICTPEFIKLAGDAAADSQYCSLPGRPLEQLAGGMAFREKFRKRFGGEIQLYAAYVYDAVMVMADAMKRAGSVEPSVYLPEVGKTDYEGLTSRIRFDDKGDLKGGAISLYQVKDLKWAYRQTLGGSSDR
jgi:branched-chain amino acid transport system substrate-binding protein